MARSYVLLLFLSTLMAVESLTCESCLLTSCPVLTDCQAGMVMEICNCCAVCAKVQGETCGGSYGLSGKCGIDMYCQRPHSIVGGRLRMSDSSEEGECKACESTIYSGCNTIQGVCQCGDSCTEPFEYSDRETCTNTVQAQDDTDYCLGKSCSQTASESECPEDSYRPAKKLSLDGCCKITQPCKCLYNSCHRPPVCPAGKRLAELRRGNGLPGSCCSQYTCINATSFRCEVGNSTFTDGQAVDMDNCLECICKDSIVSCHRAQCEMPSCEWLALTPGKCCPECKGCVSVNTGERYSNGESWEEGNSCTQCQCLDGQTHCTAAACSRYCRNPRKVPGQCCPICDGGEDVYVASNGTLTAPDYPTPCPESAKTCPNNCKKNMLIEMNGCPVCVCEDDINMCPGSASCSKICPHGYKKNHQLGCLYCRCNACPSFKCNLICSEGYAKDSGGCNKCECKNHKELTTISACFTSEGRNYVSGDMWFDGCRECYCHNGKELCSLISCPPLACDQLVVRAGDCCPSCPTDAALTAAVNVSLTCVDVDGTVHEDGDVWQFDSCTDCLCHQGMALCQAQHCPPTLCSHPIKQGGKCCAECPDTRDSQPYDVNGKSCTTAAGTTFAHGNIWKVGDCQSCTCQNGSVLCYSQVCPILQCRTTVQQKGQCCSKCTAESTYDRICVYEGNWYKHLDTWQDEYLQCTCIHGNSECESTECISCKDDDPSCCVQKDGEGGDDSIPLSFGLPVVVILSVLLLILAAVVILMLVILVHRHKKRKSTLTAIPKILEKRAINNACEAAFIKRRPKSTNLEFLHTTSDNRYNNAITRGDTSCLSPLVENHDLGNEYVQC